MDAVLAPYRAIYDYMLKRCTGGTDSLAAQCSGYFGPCNGDVGCQMQQSLLYGEACSHFQGVCSRKASNPLIDALGVAGGAFGFEGHGPEGEKAESGIFKVGDIPRKVVNSNMAHVDDVRAARAGFEDVKSAQGAIRDLGTSIEKDGFPQGTIPDTARNDRLLVPVGTKGYAVYQIKPNGNAVFKTILEAR